MLAVSFFSVVGEYMRLLLFICLPVILSSTALAIWLHFRQKKRRKIKESALASPIEISLSIPDPSELIAISPLANEDKFNLVKECRKQLTRSKAKFSALKHDLLTAASKFSKQGINENYNNHMENLVVKISAYEQQVVELQNKLEVLQAAFPVQYSSENLQAVIDQKDADLSRLTKILIERDQQIRALEGLLAESKQQYALINEFASQSIPSSSKDEVLN